MSTLNILRGVALLMSALILGVSFAAGNEPNELVKWSMVASLVFYAMDNLQEAMRR